MSVVTKLKEVCAKVPVDPRIAAEAVMIEHAYKHWYTKRELKRISVKINPKATVVLRKQATALGVTTESLLTAYVIAYAKEVICEREGQSKGELRGSDGSKRAGKRGSRSSHRRSGGKSLRGSKKSPRGIP